MQISKLSKEYVEYLNLFSPSLINNFKNGIKEESAEIKEIIAKMVKTGLELEENIRIIHERAKILKYKSNDLLNMILIILGACSIGIFIILR